MSDFELPQEWLQLKFSSVINYGKTEKVKPTEIENNTWVLELEDIEKNSSKLLNKLTFNERESKSDKNKFKKGDVLYGKLRPYLNKVIIATDEGVCSTEIVPLRAGEYLDNRYLFFWLKTPVFLRYVTQVSYGVNMPRLGTKDGQNAPFFLPPLAEQKEVANILEAYLSTISQIQARLDAIPKILEKFRQSVLIEAMNGDLTKNWRKTNNVREGWLHTSLGNVSTVSTGKTPSRKDKRFWEGGTIPWLTSSVTGLGYCYQANEYVTEVAVKENNLKVFPVGSLLLAMYGEGKTRGQVTELMLAAACNQACAVIEVDKEKVSHEFIKLKLRQNYVNIRKAASGGNQPNLNLKKVRDIAIELPSLDEQDEIVKQVEVLFAYADQIEKSVAAAKARVDNLTQSILHQAFTGQLTAEWREQNPELISGDNSAEALLAKIQAEK